MTKAANLAALSSGPAFSAYNTGTTTAVSATTWTKLVFQGESFDTANAFDSVTNNRFQPSVAGYYQLNLLASYYNNGATMGGSLAIYKNGTLYKGMIMYTGVGSYSSSTLNDVVYLNGSTDYIEGYIYATSSINILGSANTTYGGAGAHNTMLSGALVRAA